jgi:hypothetical protein
MLDMRPRSLRLADAEGAGIAERGSICRSGGRSYGLRKAPSPNIVGARPSVTFITPRSDQPAIGQGVQDLGDGAGPSAAHAGIGCGHHSVLSGETRLYGHGSQPTPPSARATC